MTDSPTHHLSTLTLERLAADDVSLSAPITSHLEGCQACQDRYARITDEHVRFVADVDVSARVDEIYRAANLGSRPRRRAWIAAGTSAFAAAIVLLVAIARQPDHTKPDGRLKGRGETLEVLRRTADGHGDVVAWADALRTGDALRFRITLPKDAYVGILGIDAAQVITAYTPAGQLLERIAGGAPTLLDGGVILDDTLGAERIVMVVCDSPRLVADVIGEARAALARAGGDPSRLGRLGRLGIATTCRETALLIRKVAP